MGETRIQRQAHDRDRELRRSVGDELRRLREDAGLTRAAVADAAGIDRSYLPLIEAGGRDASNSVLATVASVLGAEVSIRIFAATGPRIHDRTQAPMEEALLRRLHRRWGPTPEVHVFRPARGVADVVLDDRRANVLVETEIQGQLRRLEQQVRWQREKELSLPSSSVWRRPGPGVDEPVTSRLLVLRSTATLRHMASAFESTLRAAYPARTADVVEALTTADAPWPGAGIVWVWLDGKDTRLLESPPRGVRLGR